MIRRRLETGTRTETTSFIKIRSWTAELAGDQSSHPDPNQNLVRNQDEGLSSDGNHKLLETTGRLGTSPPIETHNLTKPEL
jgi:hypothetical protein